MTFPLMGCCLRIEYLIYSHMTRNLNTYTSGVGSQGLHVPLIDHFRSGLVKAFLEVADRLSIPATSLSYMSDCTSKEILLGDLMTGRVGFALATSSRPSHSNELIV